MRVKHTRVAVSDIHVDPEVQRQLRTSWRDAIARDFDETKLGIIHISPNGNGYRVLDGQHRLAAMQKLGLGDKQVRCLVYSNLSKQDEATIFLGLNNTKAVRAYDKFRVRVTEGDPVAVDILSVLEEVGVDLSDQVDPNTVRAVNALEGVYSGRVLRLKDGPYRDALLHTLSILKDAWGYDPHAFDGPLVEGLGAVMLRFGDRIDRERFPQKLAKFPGGPKGLQARAKAWRDLKGTVLRNATAEVMIEAYNNQLRTNALPAWERA